MKPFEHSALPVHVRNVNPRMETHGTDDRLAVDVSLRLMMGETGDEWDKVLRSLLGVDSDFDVESWMVTTGTYADGLPFKAKYEGYTCRLMIGSAELASIKGKINSFHLDFIDLGLTFRLQGEVDEDTSGKLCGLMKHKVELSSSQDQGELPL